MKLSRIAKIMYDIQEYCAYVNGYCGSECSIYPCMLPFFRGKEVVFPYEWGIDKDDIKRLSLLLVKIADNIHARTL